MTKIEIVKNIVENLGIPRRQAKKAVDSIFENLKQALIREERIEIRGFGAFQVNRRASKVGRNLNTNEVIQVPEGKSVKFKPGKNLREIP